MKKFTRRTWILFGVIAVSAVAAVGVYAYFTTTGSGTGTAATGSDTPLTITQVGSVTGLTPGGGAKKVGFSIANTPASNGVQNLGAVSISNIAVDEPYLSAGCLASWYSVVPGTAVGTIAAGATFTSSGGSTEPTIALDNVASDQSACKGATLTFDLDA